jgi:hypothetical protein
MLGRCGVRDKVVSLVLLASCFSFEDFSMQDDLSVYVAIGNLFDPLCCTCTLA